MTDAAPAPWLAALFDQPVGAAVLWGEADPATGLWPGEMPDEARWSPKRQRDFAAGRACARQAMSLCDMAPQALPIGADRVPAWPAQMVGSITHCQGFAAALVGRSGLWASLGIDAEPDESVNPELWPRLLCARERGWVESLPASRQRAAGTLLFSAKEAFYKCQFPLTGKWLEFHDVVVEVTGFPDDGAACRLDVVSSHIALSGSAMRIDGRVVAVFGKASGLRLQDSGGHADGSGSPGHIA